MAAEWKKVKLGETFTVKKGQAITKRESKEGPYPVILGGREPAYFIDRFNHEGKAIVVSRSGASAGYVSFWNEPIFITDGFLIEPNNDVCYEYIYYLMKNNQSRFIGSQKGAAIPHVTPALLSDIDILLPPLETQQKIAGILSAYDDLIENNRKQIKLLEEAAQKLYKEWFVKLNFPGHENVKIVDGVPEGWKKEKLINLVDVQYGYAFDGSKFNSEGNGKPIIRIRNIPQGTTDDFTTEQTTDDYIVHNGDIVVGMDGEFHINTWNQNDAYLVQRACSFRPHNENMKGYILQAIYAPIKFFENTVVGATVAHLGKKHIDTIEVLTCNEEFYIPFQNMVRKRQTLLNQIQLLQSARDKLLPKLMNGEYV